jgi:hypothetical protein
MVACGGRPSRPRVIHQLASLRFAGQHIREVQRQLYWRYVASLSSHRSSASRKTALVSTQAQNVISSAPGSAGAKHCVHGVDAPGVARSQVGGAADAVNRRVTQADVSFAMSILAR